MADLGVVARATIMTMMTATHVIFGVKVERVVTSMETDTNRREV
jgi:hypothetical protein